MMARYAIHQVQRLFVIGLFLFAAIPLKAVQGPENAWEILRRSALEANTKQQMHEAEDFFRAALQIAANDPSNVDRLGTSLCDLAGFYVVQKRYSDAEPMFLRAVTITEDAFGKDDRRVALRIDGLATLYLMQNRFAESETLRHREIAILEKQFGMTSLEVANASNLLGLLLATMGKHEEAAAAFKRALSIYGENGEADSDISITIHRHLYFEYKAAGKMEEADLLLKALMEHGKELAAADEESHVDSEKVRPTPEKMVPPTEHQVPAVSRQYFLSVFPTGDSAGKPLPYGLELLNGAQLLLVAGKLPEAEQILKEALPELEKFFGKNHSMLSIPLILLGQITLQTNRHADAEEFFLQAIRKLEAGNPARQGQLRNALAELGNLYRITKNYGEPEKVYMRIVALQNSDPHPDPKKVAYELGQIGDFYADQERAADSEKYYLMAIAEYRKEGPTGELAYAFLLKRYSSMLRTVGRIAEADRIMAESMAIRAKYGKK